MSRSLSPSQVAELRDIRDAIARLQRALDRRYAQAADVVGVHGEPRERFVDELLWAGDDWTPDDAALWADDASLTLSQDTPTHA